MIVKEIQADLDCLKCAQTRTDAELVNKNRMNMLEMDNQKLNTEIKSLLKRFDDRECELMIDNKKLKLENDDLISKKSKYNSDVSSQRDEIESLKKELQRAKDENTALKSSLRQDTEYKDTKIKELEKSNHDLIAQCDRFKNLEALSKERLKAYAQQHIKGASSSSNIEAQRKLVKDLLNYKNAVPPASASGSDSNAAKSGAFEYKQTPDDDNMSCLDTPARSIFNPSSEDTIHRENRRKFVMNSEKEVT